MHVLVAAGFMGSASYSVARTHNIPMLHFEYMPVYEAGSLGFVGSVTLEQLLRVVPDVAKAILIVRGKHGQTGQPPPSSLLIVQYAEDLNNVVTHGAHRQRRCKYQLEDGECMIVCCYLTRQGAREPADLWQAALQKALQKWAAPTGAPGQASHPAGKPLAISIPESLFSAATSMGPTEHLTKGLPVEVPAHVR